jgi:iron complex outermembrane receptor protein
MKNYRSIVFRKSMRAAILAAASLPLIVVANADAQQSNDTKDEKVQQLEKYVVTGSYIPAAADQANASPVTVLTAEEIALTGVTNSILDVLRKSVPQIVGGNNVGRENANTGGGSTNGGAAVALRNTTTLVLIDGLRVVFDPVASGGGGQFVDLNVVPVSAVERIEVLTDGASAIYGSDAVSGVINIILKKNYQGIEIGGHMGASKTDRGGYYHEREFHMVAGATQGKTSVTVSAEWNKHDPLFERDFNYTSPVHLSALSGCREYRWQLFQAEPLFERPARRPGQDDGRFGGRRRVYPHTFG